MLVAVLMLRINSSSEFTLISEVRFLTRTVFYLAYSSSYLGSNYSEFIFDSFQNLFSSKTPFFKIS